MRLTTLFAAFALMFTGVIAAPAAQAQGLFQTRVQVNDRAITNYEVQQRRLFLQVLNTPGDLDREALERLIEDRLRLDAAEAQGVTITEEQLAAGMAEFASRGGLSTDEFIANLAGQGVAEETFRDFVEAGMVWREVVRSRFAGRATVTEAEIDRALSLPSQRRPLRVLLSEIIMPATPEFIDQTGPLAQQFSRITSTAAFADAARQYSASVSAEQGGQIDWLPLANLPPAIGAELLTMQPGQVTAPITLGNAIAVFQLRALEDGAEVPPAQVSVEYAQMLIPNGPNAQADAARIRARVDTCDDLYPIATTDDQITRATQTVPQVPQDIAVELARLDAGEISANLVRGDALVLVMLCHRRIATEEPPSREAVRDQIINSRLNGHSEILLDELRANAHIRFN